MDCEWSQYRMIVGSTQNLPQKQGKVPKDGYIQASEPRKAAHQVERSVGEPQASPSHCWSGFPICRSKSAALPQPSVRIYVWHSAPLQATRRAWQATVGRRWAFWTVDPNRRGCVLGIGRSQGRVEGRFDVSLSDYLGNPGSAFRFTSSRNQTGAESRSP